MFANAMLFLTTLGIWAGIAAAIYSVRQQNKIAKELTVVQLFLQLTQQYDSEEMQRKRATLAELLLKNPKEVEIDDTLLTFFENVAHLRRRHLLEDEMTWTSFSIDIVFFHKAVEHYIVVMRQKFNAKDLFMEFENLARTWNDRMGTKVAVNDRTIKEFLRWTARIMITEEANSSETKKDETA